jgi:hypothetical protein
MYTKRGNNGLEQTKAHRHTDRAFASLPERYELHRPQIDRDRSLATSVCQLWGLRSAVGSERHGASRYPYRASIYRYDARSSAGGGSPGRKGMEKTLFCLLSKAAL